MLYHALPIDQIAAKIKLSKENTNLVLSILEKRLNSNKLTKIIKSLNLMLYLTDNGGMIFQNVLFERAEYIWRILNSNKLNWLLNRKTMKYEKNFFKLAKSVIKLHIKAHKLNSSSMESNMLIEII